MPVTETDLATAVRTVRENLAYALMDQYGVVVVEGPDAAEFLHSQTTNDVASLQPGQGQQTTLTDRKAHVQALMSLHRLGDAYWILVENEQIATILERLEDYRFTEQVQWRDTSVGWVAYTIQGPRATAFLQDISSNTNWHGTPMDGIVEVADCLGSAVVAIRKTISAEDGWFLLVPRGEATAFRGRLIEAGLSWNMGEISIPAQKTLRLEAGIPKYGMDLDAEVILPETGLQHTAVSYAKGCYIGQEVIARVKTYGSVQRALAGLVFEAGTALPPYNSEITYQGSVVGTFKSAAFSPTLGMPIALAYLGRDARVPDRLYHFNIAGTEYPVAVVMLPFYRPSGASERAHALLTEGLTHFTADREAEAITALREALLLDPHLADAYEALGVILSRQGQLDEAISLMHKLAELDPNNIMAHTNLSVFYMQQGMKEAAENEKAIATTLGFKQALVAKQNETSEAERQRQLEAAQAEKIRMFTEVLELDLEDSLANYSLGKIYVDISQWAKAIPLLGKALASDPKYTVAYLALGKALEGIGKKPEAELTYRRGIEVASQRGDLMPLQEMQQRLAQLHA